MGEIFLWGPVVFLARAALVLAIGGGTWIGGLYFLRFLRPRNVKTLASGNLPDIKEVQILGQRVTLQEGNVGDLSAMVETLNKRLGAVEEGHNALDNVVRELLPAPKVEE